MHLYRTVPPAAVLAVAVAMLAPAAVAGDGHNMPSRIVYKTAPLPPSAGATYTAVVNSKGALVRGSGATAASRAEGKGTTEVDFTNDVSACAFVATVGEPSSKGSEPASFITVVGRSGTPQGVYVETFNQTGSLTNLPFHIDVGC